MRCESLKNSPVTFMWIFLVLQFRIFIIMIYVGNYFAAVQWTLRKYMEIFSNIHIDSQISFIFLPNCYSLIFATNNKLKILLRPRSIFISWIGVFFLLAKWAPTKVLKVSFLLICIFVTISCLLCLLVYQNLMLSFSSALKTCLKFE